MSGSLQKNKQEEEQMKMEEKSLRGVEEKKEKVRYLGWKGVR